MICDNAIEWKKCMHSILYAQRTAMKTLVHIKYMQLRHSG